ncbi:uncharacterized protein LOC110841801 isoform X1 [Folsomia candida]|uniref:uncharacterized protein LOC110841801 isoform X1 n=2 Tax=Folsomia candida TaxID=158441 RepID=UPI000B8FA967|nr:uncharacterized protein LOC110841801 isoform X1 [Folsomia candida]XP_035706870.1 uncharacterized protein LOC110841801 isoform X1 [Folsomia candida]
MMDELIEIMLSQVVQNYIPSIEKSILNKLRAEMHLERETNNRITELENSVKSIEHRITNLEKSAQEIIQKTDETRNLINCSWGQIGTIITHEIAAVEERQCIKLEKSITENIATVEKRLFSKLEKSITEEIAKSEEMNKEVKKLNQHIQKTKKTIKKQNKGANQIHKANETLILNSQSLLRERMKRIISIIKKKAVVTLPNDPAQPDNSIPVHEESNSEEPNAIEAEEIETVNNEILQLDADKNHTPNEENKPNNFLSGHTSMPKLIPEQPMRIYGRVIHNSSSVRSCQYSKSSKSNSTKNRDYNQAFKCNMCPKSFSCKYTLVRHKRKHE